MKEGVLKIRSFADLNSWKEGHQLAIEIYKVTENFPTKEQFGLTGQLRRAAISITSNIAEGFSRETAKDKIRFYFMSRGSVTEIQSQLAIARDVGYIKIEEFNKIALKSITVHKLIAGMIKSLKNFI
jgi:four helix bundle protein